MNENIQIRMGEQGIEIDKSAIEQYHAVPFDVWAKIYLQPAFANLIPEKVQR